MPVGPEDGEEVLGILAHQSCRSVILVSHRSVASDEPAAVSEIHIVPGACLAASESINQPFLGSLRFVPQQIHSTYLQVVQGYLIVALFILPDQGLKEPGIGQVIEHTVDMLSPEITHIHGTGRCILNNGAQHTKGIFSVSYSVLEMLLRLREEIDTVIFLHQLDH